MTGRRLTAILAGALAAVAVAAGWAFLAPTQLGGGTSYAILVGSSMEPQLHRGDLAIVRRGDEYRAGDVVLYESRDLGANVLHRIERTEHGRFVLKGDNNDFLDPERPADAQIVGALWFHVPAVGRLSNWLREPLHAALFMGAVALVVLGGLGAGASAARRGPRRVRTRPAKTSAAPASMRADPDRALLVAGLVLAALACAALAVASYTRPLATTESVEGVYAHQGRFAYGGRVPANAVYPQGTVGTGQPVFLQLVPRLRVSFDYSLESARSVSLGGTIQLDARISDERGWERTVPLAPRRDFSGKRAHVSGTLDLIAIERVVEQVRELTGSGQATYTVSVLPRVAAAGRAGSDSIDATFEPALVFELSGRRLQPKLAAGAPGVGPFAPREAVRGARPVAASLALGPASPSVAAVRKLSLAGLAALLLLGGAALARPRRPREEHALIDARYGELIVPVSPPLPRWERVTDVVDIDALARIAVQRGRLILHLAGASGHVYAVEDGGSVYRYSTAPAPLRVALRLPDVA